MRIILMKSLKFLKTQGTDTFFCHTWENFIAITGKSMEKVDYFL